MSTRNIRNMIWSLNIMTKLISELGVGHHGLLRWHTKIEHPNALIACGQRPSHSLYIDFRASMPRHPGRDYFMSKSFSKTSPSTYWLLFPAFWNHGTMSVTIMTMYLTYLTCISRYHFNRSHFKLAFLIICQRVTMVQEETKSRGCLWPQTRGS